MRSQYSNAQWASLAQQYGIAQPAQLFRAAWTSAGFDLNKAGDFLAAGVRSPNDAIKSTDVAARRALVQRPGGAIQEEPAFAYERRGNKVFFSAVMGGARLRATYDVNKDAADFWFNNKGAGGAGGATLPFVSDDERTIAWEDSNTGLDGVYDTDENLAILDAFMNAVSTVAISLRP